LFTDAQAEMSRAIQPGGDWGELIELLDGPRQRKVQAAARQALDASAPRS
jgi:hypothetical protein